MNIFLRTLLVVNRPRTGRRAPLLAGLALLLGLGSLLAALPARAAGLLTPVGGAQALDIAEHHVDVVIENGFVVTRVDQVFANRHPRDLDARYSFPVPEGAAVGEFSYWIDGVEVQAEVLEKARARSLHESQKARGAETALVERDAYRTFEVEVSPVRAGQDVRVRLVYLQRAAVDHAIGRYVYPLEEGGVDPGRERFWTTNDTVESAFSFRLRLRSAYPVDAVRATEGGASVTQLDAGEWEVLIDGSAGDGASAGAGLDDEDIARARMTGDGTPPLPTGVDAGARYAEMLAELGLAGAAAASAPASSSLSSGASSARRLERDIVVYWRLAENLPGAVDLVTYREPGAATGTFMLTLTPGIDLAPISEGRDWIFVLDTSGSMAGKLASLVEGVRRALASLNPADRFRVVLFNDRARELTNGHQPAERHAIDATLERLARLRSGGSTNLFDGLSNAARAIEDDRTSAIVLVTDGVANVGPTEMSRFLELLEPLDVRLFTAIMGNSANRPLLEGLTRRSEGFAVSVSNDDDIVGLMMQLASKVTHEALHEVSLAIDGEGGDLRASELSTERFARVYRGEQLVVLGRYAGEGTARVTLEASRSGTPTRYVSSLEFPAVATGSPELERLWAFAKIAALEAEAELLGHGTDDADTREAIVDLALGHGLVTDHTSLVVVREEVFAAEGIDRRNQARIERERAARVTRATQPVGATRQDARAPAFPAPRHAVGNGGGALGPWSLLPFALFALARLPLGVGGRRGRRPSAGAGGAPTLAYAVRAAVPAVDTSTPVRAAIEAVRLRPGPVEPLRCPPSRPAAAKTTI